MPESPEKRSALLLDDPRFDLHAPVSYHPERPERLLAARAAAQGLTGRVTWDRVAAREATLEEIVRVHDAEYTERLEAMRGHEAHLDPDTYVVPRSVEAARLAAGGVVAMVDAILDGRAAKGAALVRPPGHHARPGQAMGFCLLNNAAIAAAHARSRGVSRVAIVDWDVHHGNGTQEMFLRDPAVLYASTHQYPFYPGSGAVNEIGEGDGRGATVNVPLSAGGGDAIYRGAFERVLVPVLEEFAPELVIISAGFDPAERDPLAQMDASDAGFGWMARALGQVADKHAKGKTLLVLEGGYDLPALESGLGAALRGLLFGEADDIPRDVDAPDIRKAARWAEKAGHKLG
jgi:acetoin utilization deacetylase AcuC-like enzyme